jgi:hypothetical protein
MTKFPTSRVVTKDQYARQRLTGLFNMGPGRTNDKFLAVVLFTRELSSLDVKCSRQVSGCCVGGAQGFK